SLGNPALQNQTDSQRSGARLWPSPPNRPSAEVARPRLLLPLGLGGHAQTQRQDRDFGGGRAARQSRASDRRSPSTTCREAVPKIPASSRWPQRDYEMERDLWWASHSVDPRHNHLQIG